MHLHGLGILHGSISPVGEVKDQVNPHTDARRVQDNILITRDSQACLGDFGITGTFKVYPHDYLQQGTLRYMAPEHFSDQGYHFVVERSSRETDVYSVAMASFSVCTSFGNASYYFVRSSRYNQVLTGVLPYHGSNVKDMITDIHAGKRPSRPIDPSKSRLLEDPVWNVITTGWRDQPERRCKLSVMYRIFSRPSQQQQLGKILPRVASFFQFLQDSESETQKHVNELNKASFSTSPPKLTRKADTSCSGSKTTPCQMGSD